MFCAERGKRQESREAKERTLDWGAVVFLAPGLAVCGSLQGLALAGASSLTGCVGKQWFCSW